MVSRSHNIRHGCFYRRGSMTGIECFEAESAAFHSPLPKLHDRFGQFGPLLRLPLLKSLQIVKNPFYRFFEK